MFYCGDKTVPFLRCGYRLMISSPEAPFHLCYTKLCSFLGEREGNNMGERKVQRFCTSKTFLKFIKHRNYPLKIFCHVLTCKRTACLEIFTVLRFIIHKSAVSNCIGIV